MEPQVQTAVIRGLATGWITSGAKDGPIFLMIHGFPDGPQSWDGQLTHFQTRFQVCAPFMRGAGPSEPGEDSERYGPVASSLDLMAIVRRLDPSETRPLVIMGHDLGVVHAWHFARLVEPRVKGLVIINGLTIELMARRLYMGRQHLKSWYIYLLQVPGLAEMAIKLWHGKLFDFAYAQGGLDRDKRPEAPRSPELLRRTLQQYRVFMRRLPRDLWAHKPKKFAKPVLVLWGRDDRFLLPPTLDELEHDALDVTVRILEGNHWLHRQDPKQVNQLIEEFLHHGGHG